METSRIACALAATVWTTGCNLGAECASFGDCPSTQYCSDGDCVAYPTSDDETPSVGAGGVTTPGGIPYDESVFDVLDGSFAGSIASVADVVLPLTSVDVHEDQGITTIASWAELSVDGDGEPDDFVMTWLSFTGSFADLLALSAPVPLVVPEGDPDPWTFYAQGCGSYDDTAGTFAFDEPAVDGTVSLTPIDDSTTVLVIEQTYEGTLDGAPLVLELVVPIDGALGVD
jgi:hypothetical protein